MVEVVLRTNKKGYCSMLYPDDYCNNLRCYMKMSSFEVSETMNVKGVAVVFTKSLSA